MAPGLLMERLLFFSDPPEKVDVLIALGSEPERAGYAAYLYELGFSDTIIITGWGSSVDKMAERAAREGAKGQDLILEKESISTYQNALYSKKIILQKGYKSAIVVSSPYHMRRTKMVFDRVYRNSGVKLLYCPTGLLDGKTLNKRVARTECVKLVYYWFRYW
ncbi:MAG TPA: hypothetical protein DCK76_12105 [Desulfotomaculum sp.]|nr:MAG: hypothetical protein XD84_1843 [Desulfotomaculum sp. 46_80]HAG12079.1 hypothetical protein [Desulfotomaculum sp.]HBY02947.1 hypothetical protein [Desulfotomaculum sp.]